MTYTDAMYSYIRRQVLRQGLENGCDTALQSINQCDVGQLCMIPWAKTIADAEEAMIEAFDGYDTTLPIESLYNPDTGVEVVMVGMGGFDLSKLLKPKCTCKPFVFAGKEVHSVSCDLRKNENG